MDKLMNENSNSNSIINISDVIDVIQKEPDYAENNNDYPSEQRQPMNMLSGGGIENVKPGGVKNSRPSGYHYQQQPRPYVVITEQPASKSLRFRYECEGRSAGSIPGVNSTPEHKTFPSIRIVGYKGRAVVVVSCVTKDLHDGKYRAHPHNLVGKEACKQGVCTVEVSSDSNMEVSFANLGIQCVKKRDIEEALATREKLRVDPFRAGFDHKNQPTSIDLNAVRLCFQVFLEGDRGKFTVALGPVVSDAIYDKKAMSDLVICKLSHCSASAAGGTNMILLCEKVAKEDIQVRFFETKNGKLTWEAFAEFSTTDVHKQVGIAFKTPKYDLKPSDEPIEVFIQLRRPSDGAASEPRPFEMIPIGAGRPAFWSLRKSLARAKEDSETLSKIFPIETLKNSQINDKQSTNNPDSNTKISALRALNNLYNEKKSINPQNNEEIKSNNNLPINFIPKYIPLEIENSNLMTTTNDNKSSTNLNSFGLSTPENKNSKNDLSNSREYQEIDRDKAWFDYSEVGRWVERGQQLTSDKYQNEDKKIDDTEIKLHDLINQVAEIDEIYQDTHSKIIKSKLSDSKNEETMEIDVHDNQTYTSLQLAMKNPIKLHDTSANNNDDDDDEKYEDILPESPPPPPPLAEKRIVGKNYDEKLPPLPPKRSRKMSSMPVLPRTSSFSDSQAPNKNLPLLPGTLFKQKQGLFSKLFTKKSKKENKDPPKPEIIARNRNSIGSLRDSLQNNFLDNSSLNRPSSVNANNNKSLDIQGDDSPPYGFDLTEAEHYALYTAMAPHATTSEFDELSFYYSPVEGGKILSDGKKT